jgi:hypothetical protein
MDGDGSVLGVGWTSEQGAAEGEQAHDGPPHRGAATARQGPRSDPARFPALSPHVARAFG